MKVLHLPTATGGMAWGLAQGEKALGLEAKVLVAADSWLHYPCDICLNTQRSGRFGRAFKLLNAFLAHRNRHDIFHFNFGSSLLDFPGYGLDLLDLPLYPAFSKLVVTYNGCDARQKYRTMQREERSACHDDTCYDGICMGGAMDQMKQRRINRFARYAHHIFAVNPDLLRNLPAKISSFLPYTIASWYDLTPQSTNTAATLTIAHAPTNRAAKGSAYILAALERLAADYPQVRIVLIENLPNREALQRYAEADIVVDQVLVGWYGGLAVEAMRMGKPVAAFVRTSDLEFIPAAMREDLSSALIQVTPESIYEQLEYYLHNRSALAWLREAALDYVHRWHDPVKVAAMTKSVYEA